MIGITQRITAAPISWGVCEVPGWGMQLPANRVLSEMQQLGLSATELGPTGYLPTDPQELSHTLSTYGLRLTGGFNPLPLANPDLAHSTLEMVRKDSKLLANAGATDYVGCVVSDLQDWARPTLTTEDWKHILKMIDQVSEIVAAEGLNHLLHPHVNSLIETAEEVQFVLDNNQAMWVLDTGHLQIGGFNPSHFVAQYSNRIGLVHLKDLNMGVAQQLNAKNLTLMEAVQAGLFVPLGQGDINIANIVRQLESHGYQHWYVIEQDFAITNGEPPEGEGPIRDVRKSVAFLQSLDESSQN